MNGSRMKDMEWIMNDKQAKSKFQGVSPVEYIVYILVYKSCLRVGWTRGSGRVWSGHDFAGFWRVGSGQHFGFISFY